MELETWRLVDRLSAILFGLFFKSLLKPGIVFCVVKLMGDEFLLVLPASEIPVKMCWDTVFFCFFFFKLSVNVCLGIALSGLSVTFTSCPSSLAGKMTTNVHKWLFQCFFGLVSRRPDFKWRNQK